MASVDKINVRGDPRVKHCTTFVNGTTYGMGLLRFRFLQSVG
jgi:hypothetical protein